MSDVTITISAEPNNGKTTIARIIEAALKEKGFVSVKVEDAPSTIAHKEPVAQRFEAAKQRPITIKVEVVEEFVKCKRSTCSKPVAYRGAEFCGAGCSARWEGGDR